jgi:hypothetical protein
MAYLLRVKMLHKHLQCTDELSETLFTYISDFVQTLGIKQIQLQIYVSTSALIISGVFSSSLDLSSY